MAPAVGLERNPADLQLLTHEDFEISSATCDYSFNTRACLRLPFTGAFTGGRHKPTPPSVWPYAARTLGMMDRSLGGERTQSVSRVRVRPAHLDTLGR